MTKRRQKLASTEAIEAPVARLSETALMRRFAAHLKRVEPGQKMSNFDLICQGLINKAKKGDVKAFQCIIESLRQLDIKAANRKKINITADMPVEQASRLYLESLKQTEPYDDDDDQQTDDGTPSHH